MEWTYYEVTPELVRGGKEMSNQSSTIIILVVVTLQLMILGRVLVSEIQDQDKQVAAICYDVKVSQGGTP